MKLRRFQFAALAVTGALVLFTTGCNKEHGHAEDSEDAAHKHADIANAPKGAAQTASQVALSGEKCPVHKAPKELCFICDATLRDKKRLWCNEHARYEDRCWLCHPELQDKARLYCEEHGMYEDECFICHPDATGVPSAASEPSPSALMCKEHGILEAECGICHPELSSDLKPGEGLKVRLPAVASATMAGMKVGTAEGGGLSEIIECLAEIKFDQNKLAEIAAPVSGIIQSVEVDLGDKVKEQQVVAKIWSANIAETVAKAVLTHQTLERERKLRLERVTSERDLQQAEAEHRAACQQARTLGFSEEELDSFAAKPDEPVMLEVRVPFAGEIVERRAVRGALVEAGKPLFTLVDRSTMWAILSLPEAELGRVEEGQTVELQLESQPGQVVTGKLTWIAAQVDDRTRLASARVEVPNPSRALRANMFAKARILVRSSNEALVLPNSAVHLVDGRPLVFVKLADDLFEARAVRLGTRSNGKLEIVAGLKASEQLVLANGFPLKSQLLISRLGAGCAHE